MVKVNREDCYFADMTNRPTPACYGCGKSFWQSFDDSTQEQQFDVMLGFMQVCSCHANGAYLVNKIQVFSLTLEEQTGRKVKSVDTLHNSNTVEVMFYDSPNPEWYIMIA